MPADEYLGDIARSLRRVARSSIDQLVATRLEALAADHKLRASKALRMGVANANKIVLSHPQASRIVGPDTSDHPDSSFCQEINSQRR